ncbi:MAG: hypothetical protein RMM17_04245 [Acidobacteriota bacterium]|nr:hypothetical protein [Blastocatellia bacterium]MDW8411872.1 hypothetical protein [Acidobacteriota bacterium]
MANDIKTRLDNANLLQNIDRAVDKRIEQDRQEQVVLYSDLQQVELRGRTTVEGLLPEYSPEALSFKEAMRLDQLPPTHAELEPPSIHYILYAFGNQTQRKMNFEKLTRTQKQKTGQLMQKLGQSLAQVPEHLKEQLEKEARMLNLVDYLIQIQDGILARVGSRTKG